MCHERQYWRLMNVLDRFVSKIFEDCYVFESVFFIHPRIIYCVFDVS